MKRIERPAVLLLAVLMAICVFLPVLSETAGEVDKTINLCRNGLDPRTAYLYSGGGDPARSAFDGKTTTWCVCADDFGAWGNLDKWVQCDLGQEYWIGRYIVKPCYALETWNFAVTKFQLKVSLDGENWTLVHEVDSETPQIEDHTFEPVKARYIRVYGEGCKGDHYVRFAEIEVYAADPPTTEANATEAAATEAAVTETPAAEAAATETAAAESAATEASASEGGNAAPAQDKDKVETKDETEKKSSLTWLWIVIAAVLFCGAATAVLLKKKKAK